MEQNAKIIPVQSIILVNTDESRLFPDSLDLDYFSIESSLMVKFPLYSKVTQTPRNANIKINNAPRIKPSYNK